MSNTKTIDYNRPVKISENVFWVGFYDKKTGLHCNPYLIIDNDEAIVIDGGSRPDFPTVMMKILQTGITPSQIKALIYHHYDPDLCGSVQNFEDIIQRDDLIIISDKRNHMFISHYSVSSVFVSLDEIKFKYKLSSGRELSFIGTPYAHTPGCFVTFDRKTGIVFTSDIFGSYSVDWNLFLDLPHECMDCMDYISCPAGKSQCDLAGIINFHKSIMTSEKALYKALQKIDTFPYKIIAPQHGSVLTNPETIEIIQNKLLNLKGVGIDGEQ
jgi:flavorubredoxin